MTKPEDETLESLLRARLADPRAATAAVTISADRIFLTFGDVGPHRRISLRVIGDEIGLPETFTAEPEAAAEEAGEEDEAAESAPVDPSKFSKDELLELAADEEVEGISSANTKPEIAAAINAKREAAST